MFFFKACNVYGSANRTMPGNASAKQVSTTSVYAFPWNNREFARFSPTLGSVVMFLPEKGLFGGSFPKQRLVIKANCESKLFKLRGSQKGRKSKLLQTNPGILKTAHLACHAWVCAPTFDAVISCHNWPTKCLAFRGAEMNFRGRVCETKIIFFSVFWNAWTALMVKSQWIRTINSGFVHWSS